MSLPVWGEWIEIFQSRAPLSQAVSLPVWGEWIEIGLVNTLINNRKSLPVWGEWIEMCNRYSCHFPLLVSPRVGRVD